MASKVSCARAVEDVLRRALVHLLEAAGGQPVAPAADVEIADAGHGHRGRAPGERCAAASGVRDTARNGVASDRAAPGRRG